MENKWFILFVNVLSFNYILADYAPISDGVEAGSVLLPTTRRGKYLANIIRRQAVDGTGIHFNKDADRLNAEAKKKVDILSPEFIPHIITEQERKVDLYYKMIHMMKHAEHGVSVFEVRNRPPLIIRENLFYRCPEGTRFGEPHSNIEHFHLYCLDRNDNRIQINRIPMDSCFIAEDAILYKTAKEWFFCNRKFMPGFAAHPNDPTNITLVACEPKQRTSYFWTIMVCSIMNTPDIIFNIRHYVKLSYRTYIREMDPDHEVCDNLAPCQVGYMFSLPLHEDAIPVLDSEPNCKFILISYGEMTTYPDVEWRPALKNHSCNVCPRKEYRLT